MAIDPRLLAQSRGNPMAVHAKEATNPLARILERQNRERDQKALREREQKALRDSPRNFLRGVSSALSITPMRGVSSALSTFTGFTPMQQKGAAWRVPVPETEAEVNRREAIRERYDQYIRDVNENIVPNLTEQAYNEGRSFLEQRRKKQGAFLKRAYDAYEQQQAERDMPIDPVAAVMMRRQGQINPILEQYNQLARRRAMKKFQQTHSWARKKENLPDLDVAINYLMSRPNFNESVYGP